jgi:AmiR/NasT family two-component response regulator
VATRFAPYAAIAAGNLDQAKGILMERHKLTADEAFQALARASVHTNRKVRDVAEHLVSTGEIPPR